MAKVFSNKTMSFVEEEVAEKVEAGSQPLSADDGVNPDDGTAKSEAAPKKRRVPRIRKKKSGV